MSARFRNLSGEFTIGRNTLCEWPSQDGTGLLVLSGNYDERQNGVAGLPKNDQCPGYVASVMSPGSGYTNPP